MISKEEVIKLAKLARLDFSDDELDKIIKDMDDIIAFADTINNSVEGDADKIRNILGWKPKYGINDAIRTTVNCYKKLLEADSNEEVSKIMEEKINEFFM